MRWLKDEWNKPSRTDHYLMQLAAVQASGKAVTDMKIEFRSKEDEKPKTEDEVLEEKRLRAMEAKAAWHSRRRQSRTSTEPAVTNRPSAGRRRRG